MSSKNKTDQATDVSLNLPRLLLVVTFFLISLAQIQRIQLAPNVAFYAHDFFICVLIISLALSAPNLIERLSKFIKNYQWLIIFLGWAFIGLILNQLFLGFYLIPWLYWARLICYLTLGSLLVVHKNFSGFKSWLKIAFFVNFFTLILGGIVQYLLVPDLRFLAEAGWDQHFYRMAGTMLDPNFFGMLLILGLITWLLKINTNFAQGKKIGKKLIKIIISMAAVACLTLTYSRSSYLSFLVVMTVLIISPHHLQNQLNKKLGLGLLILFLLLLPFLPRPGGLGVKLSRTETLSSRYQVNRTLLEKLNVGDYVAGRGLFTPTINTQKNDTRIVHAHFPDNLLVLLISATGIPGMIIALNFFLEKLTKLYRNNLANFLLLTAILVHSMFNLSLLEPINLLMLLMTLAI